MTTHAPHVFSAAAGKLASFPEKMGLWIAGESFTPITLEIQPTERCNHRCPNCQARYALPGGEVRQRRMSGVDLDLSLLDSVWEQPPSGVVISGNTGDPLIHSKAGELLDRLGTHGIPAVLISNGEAATPEIASIAVRVCRGIRISLDACDSASFRLTHGMAEDSWERVLNGVRLFLDARSRSGIQPDDCLIGVGYLTDDRTRSGMVRATELAKNIGVDYIQFRPFHFRACSIEAELGACRALEEAPRFRVLASDQKYERSDLPERSYTRCHGASFYTVLDARGDFYICCHHIGQQEARIGSLREQTWQDFIRSSSRREKTQSFPVQQCVPLCRLHAHNEVLQQIVEGGSTPRIELSAELARHACFL